uniref:Uncharacterized protein n=1 Tax=Parascaris univalens TaxID=6257 RepID=A0A915CD12_PARUN
MVASFRRKGETSESFGIYCPRESSIKKSGMPARRTIRVYGMRKTPENTISHLFITQSKRNERKGEQ